MAENHDIEALNVLYEELRRRLTETEAIDHITAAEVKRLEGLIKESRDSNDQWARAQEKAMDEMQRQIKQSHTETQDYIGKCFNEMQLSSDTILQTLGADDPEAAKKLKYNLKTLDGWCKLKEQGIVWIFRAIVIGLLAALVGGKFKIGS